MAEHAIKTASANEEMERFIMGFKKIANIEL